MINFFSRTPDLSSSDGTIYHFKEPSLGRTARPSGGRLVQSGAVRSSRETRPVPGVLPTNYDDIVAFFRRTVSDRRSPYNQLCRAADQLKAYIPDEVSRLQVAYEMLKDQITPDSLSLAISTHISDIDLARQKAGKHTPELVEAETRRLRQEIDQASARRKALADQVNQAKQTLAKLQAQFEHDDQQLSSLQKQLDSVQSSANSTAFLDQAAENEKNDLLARKVMLGLT